MALLGLLNFIFIRIPIFVLLILLFNLKNSFSHKVTVLLIVISCSSANFLSLIEPPRRTHENPSQKKCYANQRLIQGAVEAYGFDHNDMMSSLDLSLLIKEKYLKEEPKKPTDECEYYSEGDLTENGYIACKKHDSFYVDLSKISKKQEEEKKTLFYKIKKFFSSFDKPLNDADNKTRNILEIIDKTPVLGRGIAVLIFYFVIIVLGFTISVTSPAFLIVSIVQLILIFYIYWTTKAEINKTNKPLKN
jgi:competence protein ComGC